MKEDVLDTILSKLNISTKIPQEELTFLNKVSKGNTGLLYQLIERRAYGEPLAYISGETEFFGRTFKVDSRVYIPTQETEALVTVLLQDLPRNAFVIDVGTGSGAIGLSISLERADVKVIGCDLDPNALRVTQENAHIHNVHFPTFRSSYVDSVDTSEPTHVIADLPWGDTNMLLGSNDLNVVNKAPATSCFHPEGSVGAYAGLFRSIEQKGWKPIVYIESGLLSKEAIQSITPPGSYLHYIPKNNYSISIVDMRPQSMGTRYRYSGLLRRTK